MVLQKSKKLLLITLLVLGILALVVITTLLLTREDNETAEFVDVPQTQEESEQTAASAEAADGIIKEFQTEDFENTVANAIEFSRDENNELTLRLQSYATCILAAKAVSDTANMDLCKSEAESLLTELESEQDRADWQALLNTSYSSQSETNQEPVEGELR